MSKKKPTLKQMKRAAGKAPRWVRDIAAAHFDPVGVRAYRAAKLGTFGAASEVRQIDPATIWRSRDTPPLMLAPVSPFAKEEPAS